MRAPVETMTKSNWWCSEESVTTRKLDHLDHIVVLFVYLYTPRFRSPETEKKKKGNTVQWISLRGTRPVGVPEAVGPFTSWTGWTVRK